MAANDNIIFKTHTSKTIDDLFTWNKSTGAITAKTDEIPITPGTVYFTSDGHIIYDLDSTHRLWMGKEAYSAIYASDVTDSNDLASKITDLQNQVNAAKYWGSLRTTANPSDITEPTFKATRLVAEQGASKSAVMEYNATTETLSFSFT